MSYYSATGVILKRRVYGEADRILTVYTKHHGKKTVIAKGVRRITSRKGGNVELFNLCKFAFACGRRMDVVTEAEVLDSFSTIRRNLTVVGRAYMIAELVDQFTVEGQESERVFDMVVEAYEYLGSARGAQVLAAFEVKLLTEMGFWSPSQVKDKPLLYKVLRFFQEASFEKATRLSLDTRFLVTLDDYLTSYIEGVLERQLSSQRFSYAVAQM